ncbi:hypothetical protein GC163_06485 [bacterium]|nr:hypothetical protein [bacterium]
MHALFHTLGAFVVLPYLALALLFVFIGQVAKAEGLLGIVNVVWNNVDSYLGWWIYVAPVLWLGLIAAGFVPQLQRAGSLCLGFLAIACVLVIITLSSRPVGLGELLFLLPCVAVAATSAWLFLRGGATGAVGVTENG